MQPIQDKEFDQLFQDTFADAEVQPSRNLWSNIESKIEANKKKKFPIYWMVAATILIVATIGLLVNKQQDNGDKILVKNHAKDEQPIINQKTIQDSSKAALSPVETKLSAALPAQPQQNSSFVSANIKGGKPAEKQNGNAVPEIQQQKTAIVKAEEPRKDLNKQIEEAISQHRDETVIAAVNLTPIKADEPINNNEPLENKGIRNVGDLVNLVVNKVDKRKEKFIQFRTDDDDNSSISSINIGPFKFGNRKK